MANSSIITIVPRITLTGIICATLALFGACASPPAMKGVPGDREIADVIRISQDLRPYAVAAGNQLSLGECSAPLLTEFRDAYFAPWTRPQPKEDPAEMKEFMARTVRHTWYGENRRIMAPGLMRNILGNCALENFPARNETAIAVAPSHMRGLPTLLPLYEKEDDYPFDMLEFPNVKLNEPLRVLHASRDGYWLYVENGNSAGWMESRDVALVDRGFIDAWMARPQLVIIQDFTTISDSRWETAHRAKIGTFLPLVSEGDGWWDVMVATAEEARRGVASVARLPHGAAARFPLPFGAENIAFIGNQLMGQPYGWGEMYDLRDCSAMLRDLFLPFGIWLPRTSSEQIASVRQYRRLEGMAPEEKEKVVRQEGRPFLSLIYKPGHIMLYIGTDPAGRPLVFQNAWSIRLEGDSGEREHVIGRAVITTLEPGKELGVAKGKTLLEQALALGTITGQCSKTR